MKAIILLSGGLDSAVAAGWAKGKFDSDCLCLLFKYGQRHRKELEQARKLAEFFGMPSWLRRIEIPSLSALTTEKDNLNVVREGVPDTFVPGRNMIFIAYAASLAYELGATHIVGGWNSIDNPGYPDCGAPFLSSMEITLNYALGLTLDSGKFIRVRGPLILNSKKEIIERGLNYHIPFEMTWTCYEGRDKPCGECSACKFRAKGFKEAGISDPLLGSNVKRNASR